MQCTPEIHTGRLVIHAMYPGDTYRQVGDTCSTPEIHTGRFEVHAMYPGGTYRQVGGTYFIQSE